MGQFSVGQDELLSWSPPVPPNGVILHYNVIISTATSGEVVSIVEEWEQLTIDVSNYGEINMDYNVTVRTYINKYFFRSGDVNGGSFPWKSMSHKLGIELTFSTHVNSRSYGMSAHVTINEPLSY